MMQPRDNVEMIDWSKIIHDLRNRDVRPTWQEKICIVSVM
jgi:hypothetical protein